MINRGGNSKLVLFVKGHVKELWLLGIEAWLRVYKQSSSHSIKVSMSSKVSNHKVYRKHRTHNDLKVVE